MFSNFPVKCYRVFSGDWCDLQSWQQSQVVLLDDLVGSSDVIDGTDVLQVLMRLPPDMYAICSEPLQQRQCLLHGPAEFRQGELTPLLVRPVAVQCTAAGWETSRSSRPLSYIKWSEWITWDLELLCGYNNTLDRDSTARGRVWLLSSSIFFGSVLINRYPDAT